jgi:acyl-CoA reductase-like NAD-dependent aldehyde dehydrogenase
MSFLGSLVSKEAAERNKALLDDAVAKGAKVVAGRRVQGHGGQRDRARPRRRPAMRIYAEESFGPVKPVIRVKGVDEAVRVANDTEYGLSAAVFGKDVARAMSVARRIQSGICHINAPTVHDEGQMPFGWHQVVGLRPLRRQGRDRRIHRAALDHNPDRAASLFVLRSRFSPLVPGKGGPSSCFAWLWMPLSRE